MDLTKIFRGMENGAEAIDSNFNQLVDAQTSDTGWQNLVMINGFVAHSTNTPQWRKVGNHVFVRGLLDTPIKEGKFANIPNAAPKQLSGFVCSQGSSNSTDMARVYANTDGSLEVIAMATSAKAIQLNSIQYWTD